MDLYKYLLGVHDMPTVPYSIRHMSRTITPVNALYVGMREGRPDRAVCPDTHLTYFEFHNIHIAHANGHPSRTFMLN